MASALEVASLDGIGGEGDSSVVGGGCLVEAVEAFEEIAAGSVVEVVATNVELVDYYQSGRKPTKLCDGNGPVESDDRGRIVNEELVVELDDLRPVGGRGGVGVHGGDRRLYLIGPGMARRRQARTKV